MKSETKLFLGIIIGTVAIIAVGVALLSKPASTQKVDSTYLVREDSHKIASGSGTVTLVEFSDFQCPACGSYYAPVKQLKEEFKADMALVYRNFPLVSIHKNAQIAAQAAEAAGLQGKFWEMHDKLFETQPEWSGLDKPVDKFTEYAKAIGIDEKKFLTDIETDTVKQKVQADVDDGNALGISGTPSFYVNGEKIDNPASFADFESIIKAAIKKAPKPSVTKTEAYHIHANFKVFLNGSAMDFSSDKYDEKNPDIHVHDAKGDLIHIHKQGMTLGTFFDSLGVKIPETAKMYVNGQSVATIANYVPVDLDKILITDGPIVPVSDDACIYSMKCPERGTPPTEKCAGGLGTDCKD